MKPFAVIGLLLLAAPAAGSTLRGNYEKCVAETYVDLLLARAPRQAAEPQSKTSK